MGVPRLRARQCRRRAERRRRALWHHRARLRCRAGRRLRRLESQMMKRTIVFLGLLATPTFAHLVPIAPSTCALTMRLVAGSATASVDPPSATDLVRVSYEPDASPTRS